MRESDLEHYSGFYLSRTQKDRELLERLFQNGFLPQIPEQIRNADERSRIFLLELLVIAHLGKLQKAGKLPSNPNHFYKNDIFFQVSEHILHSAESILQNPLYFQRVSSHLMPSTDFNLGESHIMLLYILNEEKNPLPPAIRTYFDQVKNRELPFHPEYYLLSYLFGVMFKAENPPPLSLIQESLLFNVPKNELPEGVQRYSLKVTDENFQVIPLNSAIAIREEGEFQENCLRTGYQSYLDEIRKGTISLYSLRNNEQRVTVQINSEVCIPLCLTRSNMPFHDIKGKLKLEEFLPEEDRIKNDLYFRNILETLFPHIENTSAVKKTLLSYGRQEVESVQAHYKLFTQECAAFRRGQVFFAWTPLRSYLKAWNYQFALKNRYSIDLENDFPLLISNNNNHLLLFNYSPKTDNAPLLVRKWVTNNWKETERIIHRLRRIPHEGDEAFCRLLFSKSDEGEELDPDFWTPFSKIMMEKTRYCKNNETFELENQASSYLKISGDESKSMKELLCLLQKNKMLPPLSSKVYRSSKKAKALLFGLFMFDFLERRSVHQGISKDKQLVKYLFLSKENTPRELQIQIDRQDVLEQFRIVRSLRGGLDRLCQLLDFGVPLGSSIRLVLWENKIEDIPAKKIRLVRRVLTRRIEEDFTSRAIRILLAEKAGIILRETYHPTYKDWKTLYHAMNVPKDCSQVDLRYVLTSSDPFITILPLDSRERLKDEESIQVSLYFNMTKAWFETVRFEKSYFSVRQEGKRITIGIDSQGCYQFYLESGNQILKIENKESEIKEKASHLKLNIKKNGRFKPIQQPLLTRHVIPMNIRGQILNKDDHFLDDLGQLGKLSFNDFNEMLNLNINEQREKFFWREAEWHGKRSFSFMEYFRIEIHSSDQLSTNPKV